MDSPTLPLNSLSFYSIFPFSSGAHIRYCAAFVQIKCYFPHVSHACSCTRRSHDMDAVLCHLAEIFLVQTCPDNRCISLDDCGEYTIWCTMSLHGFYRVMAYFMEHMTSFIHSFFMMETIVWLLIRMLCKTKKFFLSSY